MAKGTELDVRERRASAAILGVLGADGRHIVPRDVQGAPSGSHDFDIVTDLATTAVEVSTLADHRAIGAYAGWFKMAPDGLLEVSGLARGWLLMVDATGSSPAAAAGVQSWLADLESRQEFSVNTRSWQRHLFEPVGKRPANFETLRSMAAAGITLGSALETAPAGQVHIAIGDGGYTYDPTDRGILPRFVSEQLAGAHRSDVDKLGGAAADARILFLWLDAQSFFPIVRSLDQGPPDGDLTNVGALNEVWIGRHFRDDAVTVYRWRRDHGWTRHDVPPIQSETAGVRVVK